MNMETDGTKSSSQGNLPVCESPAFSTTSSLRYSLAPDHTSMPHSYAPFEAVAALQPATAYKICMSHMTFIENLEKGQSASGNIDDVIGQINTHVKAITDEKLIPIGELAAYFLLKERVTHFLSSFDTSVLWVFNQNEIDSFYCHMRCELEMWMYNMHRLALQRLQQNKTRSARKVNELYESVCHALIQIRDECANVIWCRYVDVYSYVGIAITTNDVVFYIPRSHPNIAS